MIYEGSSLFSLTGFCPFISVQGETSMLWLNIGDCVLVCWFGLTNINSKQKLLWYCGKARLTHRRRGEETGRSLCRVVSRS